MKTLRQIFMMALISLVALSSFGQASDLFFSEYAEGSSYNKYVEIYNGTGGTVDLSNYQVKKGTNGANFSASMTLSGTLADGEVYVISREDADPIIVAESDEFNGTVINFNGDDVMGLFNNDVLIDIIGEVGPDPGSGWEVAGVSNGTQNHTLVRKPDVCEPTTDWTLSAGTNTDDSQWIVNDNDYWDNLGFHVSNCQGGDIVATPEFSIPAGTFTEPISVAIICATEGADIYYTTDGSDPDEDSEPYVLPINISETTTLKARAYFEDYTPSFIASAQYVFPATVANLAELRNGNLGETYIVTGEVWLTFQQDFRGNKYFQDATAGILIDDDAGIIFSDFEIGDGVVGLSGVLGEFGGMMQLVPDSDPGDPVSSGNFPEPQVITVGELFSNFEEYESELVQLNVTFADGGGTFDNGSIYPLIDGNDTVGNFRTTFYDVDYIGTAIPGFPIDVVGLPNSRTDGEYITSRDLNDFILGNIVATPYFDPEGGDFENPVEVEILCDTPDAEIYYTTDGTEPDQSSTLFIDPIEISETTILKARAYKDDFDPSLIATAQYNFAATVANLAELRAGVIGNTYTISGEVWLTFQQSYRNQKFIQDATAGILIDDAAGTLVYEYEIGDGITGLSGVLDEYNGMIQFLPDADPGNPTSSGNFPEPQVVSINELFSNFDDYQSVLVKIESANFADAGGTFSTGTVYPISDDSKAEGNFRTSFYDADYIGSTIQAAPTDIIGLPNTVYGENYITARTSDDLIENQVPPAIVVQTPNGGETWQQTKTYEISWLNINFSNNVKVIVTKPPLTNILIADDITNTGSFTWTIPEDFTLGDNYKIKVQGMESTDPLDVSDGFFSIIEALPDPNVVINEIMYNPSTELGNDDEYEYLELYNNSGFEVDLSGWTFAQGITWTFEAGTTIADDAYLVVAVNPASITAHYGITNVVGPFSGALGNSGETVELHDANGNQMDIVTYDDGGDWPSEPDGDGPSLELLDPNLDNSLPENWAASTIINGTPGTENFPTQPVITVVTPNGGEEIYQEASYDITWTYANYEGTVKVELMSPDKAAATLGYAPVADMTFAWMVSEAIGESYTVKVSDSITGEPMDESDAVFSIVPPAELPDIVINEIMYNPPEAGTDSLEFIELYNNGTEMVNLENWYFSQGVDFVFPSVDLNAGDYLVVAYKSEIMMAAFGVEALQWTGGGLSNGGEDIELRNASDVVIDYVDYDNGGFWANAPNGFGPSLALVDPSSDNELPESWMPETVYALDNAEGIAVYASPGAMNFSTPGQGVLIASGWNGVSTYTDPDNPSVEQIMSGVIDNLVVMQDFSQIYYPAFNINTIVNWDNNKGYQLNLDATKYLVLYGEESADKTVALTTGWNSLPVLSTCPVDATSLFSSITEVIFAKEMGGSDIYWPDGGLFTLDFLEPGKAYYIKVSADVSITFPDCSAKGGFSFSDNTFQNNTPWSDVSPTAASHSFGIDAAAMETFRSGDVIGAFTTNGFCAGMVEVSDENVNLMTWADDIYTSQVDGLEDNEGIVFKLFKASTGETVELTPVFDANWDHSGLFTTHGISRITDFKAGTTGIFNPETAVEIYPNPTSGVLHINVDASNFDHFEIYSSMGQKVRDEALNDSHMLINLKNLDTGIYFIKFVNSVSGEISTLNFIKN